MLAFFYTIFFAFLTIVQKTLYDYEPNLREYQGSSNLSNRHLRESLKHTSLNMAAKGVPEALSLSWIKTLPEDVQEAAESISSHLPNLFPKEAKKRTKSKSAPSSTELQADDHSVYIAPPLLQFAELLSTPPEKEVQVDWSIVCGTYTHYDNKNWKNFLRQSGAPYLYRMLAANTYETATISRIFKETNEDTKDTNSENQKESHDSSKDFEVLIHASTWFLEFDTKFHLGETFIETDPDKTESKTTFFFVTPYHLVQSKIKAKYRLLNIWHFWEHGFNMTILDKDRLTTAQKFFKRNK